EWLPELLSEPDENSFGAPYVAEPIRVLVLDHFADEFRAAPGEPGERIIDVLHGEHYAQVAERVHGVGAVIGNHGGREESRDLEPAVSVRRTHHGNLDAHAVQSGDTIGPVSFDGRAPLELEAEFGEEFDSGIDVFHHDADVVHALDRHDVSVCPTLKMSDGEAVRLVVTASLSALFATQAAAYRVKAAEGRQATFGEARRSRHLDSSPSEYEPRAPLY